MQINRNKQPLSLPRSNSAFVVAYFGFQDLKIGLQGHDVRRSLARKKMARRRNLTAAAGVPSNGAYQVPNERIQAAPLDLVGRAAVRHVREVITLQERCGSA